MGRGGKIDELAVEVERGFSESVIDDLDQSGPPWVSLQFDENGEPWLEAAMLIPSGPNDSRLRVRAYFTIESGKEKGEEATIWMVVDPEDPLYRNCCQVFLGRDPDGSESTELLEEMRTMSKTRATIEERSGNGVTWLEIVSFHR